MREEHRAIHGRAERFRQTLRELNEIEHPAIVAGGERLRSLATRGGGAAELRETGATILELLDLHFRKEEDILFPMAREVLSPQAMRDVARGMEAIDLRADETRAELSRIGRTPMIVAQGVFAKLECANPGGSVKDRIAKFMLDEATARGELRPGDVIVETTSGNTGIALAWVGRALGHRVLIFMPEHMSDERRRMLETLGAEVRLTAKEIGFQGAVRLRDAYRGRPGYYVPDQFGNPDNTRCHATTTGVELLAQLRENGCTRLDYFVAGVGTGGTLMGVGQALREAMPGVRVVAVEPAESAVMSGGPAGDHDIMGIGDGFVPDLVHLGAVDEILCVSSTQARAVAARIRALHGYCVGISSGANMAAALELRARGATVATVWPDSSDRYASVGLDDRASIDVRCPQRPFCEARARALLGD
jgi:cysteine synthase A